jgi:hypothetical protein
MAGASAETVAWIVAGGTAAGALIGSAAGGVVSFRLERARERRRALAGARLVRLDLAPMASALRDAEHDGKWWVFRDVDPMQAWIDYAEILSVRLSVAQFEDVTQSVSELSRFSKNIRNAPRNPQEPFWTLNSSAVDRLRDMRTQATKAFNALAKVAKDENVVPEGRLLHEDQQPT